MIPSLTRPVFGEFLSRAIGHGLTIHPAENDFPAADEPKRMPSWGNPHPVEPGGIHNQSRNWTNPKNLSRALLSQGKGLSVGGNINDEFIALRSGRLHDAFSLEEERRGGVDHCGIGHHLPGRRIPDLNVDLHSRKDHDFSMFPARHPELGLCLGLHDLHREFPQELPILGVNIQNLPLRPRNHDTRPPLLPYIYIHRWAQHHQAVGPRRVRTKDRPVHPRDNFRPPSRRMGAHRRRPIPQPPHPVPRPRRIRLHRPIIRRHHHQPVLSP
mmetsp:Transcript_9013/g.18185  ORF Transcript_9013/g.18185 Transcript_9013/m.18185 type:complete len:270 (-) Transcript_9013:209-1018(-)